jgi:predicted SAM-dependent methyltransferase
MLHVAPEPCFEPRFKKSLGDHYLSADLLDPQAMVKMDITDIQYADQSFDVIYCSHVLEHVPDDKKAMREFFRILKNDGWAILLVPITGEETFEDPSIVNPEERLKAFGQEDHVRIYGRDYVDRLRESGFNVEIIRVEDMVDKNDAARMGFTAASGEVFYCTKA